MIENRTSCLFAKQRNGETAVLFEGGNPLPFFWLMLLGTDDIRLYVEKMKTAERDNPTVATSLGLDKMQAIMRATGRRAYIEKYHASCLYLFDDWIYFLQISDFSDMKIYIDLYEVCACYQDIERFEESLLRAVSCFDDNEQAWYEDTIAGTCGYEGRNKNKKRFEDFSKNYREKNKKDIYGRFEQRVYLGKKTMSYQKRRLMVILVLIGMVLMAIGIIGLLYLIK